MVAIIGEYGPLEPLLTFATCSKSAPELFQGALMTRG
jgi:hypothetical protein